MKTIGFDIGGTNIAAGLVDENGMLHKRASLPFPKDKDFEKVLAACEEIVRSLEEGESGISQKVGIAVPGSLDRSLSIVLNAFNLGFSDTPLKQALSDRLKKEVFLINDADAAIVAEHRVGSLRGCKTAAMVTLGTGLGAALILNDRLFRGGRGSGTEPGHMILVNGGRPCSCGNRGCAEAYCAATRLAKDGAALGLPDAKAVIDAAKASDKAALELFSAYVDDLGAFLASLINCLDPEKIAIGGGVCAAGDFLLKPLQESVDKCAFFADPVPIVLAIAGNDAGIYGAAYAVR